MEKNNSGNKVSPALFDIKQDLSGDFNYEIVKTWLSSDKTEDSAKRILSPFKVRGTIVSSDSCGLSKLSREMNLIEVLALIDQPKKLVHSYGSSIGGKDLGIWSADNTQMFYDETIELKDILSMLLSLQSDISVNCSVKIGLGVHYGDYYLIGGGFYGNNANGVEDVAENETKAGEVLISQSIFEKIKDENNFLVEEMEFTDTRVGKIYKVKGKQCGEISFVDQGEYTIPYSEEFYNDLCEYWKIKEVERVDFVINLEKKYSKEKVIVLCEIKGDENVCNEVCILNNLSNIAVMKTKADIVLAETEGFEIKTAVNLGIYAFGDIDKAIEFSRTIQNELSVVKIESRIGIDKGQVMIFDLKDKGKDIVGIPVNVASKISQDLGDFGRIYAHERITSAVDASKSQLLQKDISGVVLNYFEIRQ